MDFGSEAPTKNLRRQKVASYFYNLESILFLKNQINIDGDMVQYVVTKLSRNSDYKFAESRTWISEVKLQPKI
jgi:hypothetical protein